MDTNFNIENEIKELKELLLDKKTDRIFGKYHDIFLLFIGFVFTTIAGGSISYIYQLKLNEHQKEQIDYENRKKSEVDLFQNISEIITERQLMACRLMYRLKNKKPKLETDEYYNKYLESTIKWSKYHAMANSFIKSNFDDSTYYYFDEIKDVFVNKQHINVIKYYEKSDSLIYYERFQAFDSIQKLNISNFYDKLSDRIYVKL
jgi:hypothetical protein